MNDFIAIGIAAAALNVSVISYTATQRFRKSLTEPKMVARFQHESGDCFQLVIVNIGKGIAYDVTLMFEEICSMKRGDPPWNLDLGDLLPGEQRVPMALSAQSLSEMSPFMIGIMYEKETQYSYPTVDSRLRRRRARYQRAFDLGYIQGLTKSDITDGSMTKPQ